MLNDYMISIGYSIKQIDKIRNTYPVCHLKEDTLLNSVKTTYNFFIKYGYTNEEIIKMTTTSPHIYELSIDNIKEKIDSFTSFGYKKEEIIKISKTLPTVISSISNNNLQNKIKFLLSLGLNNKKIIHISKKLPAIYTYSIDYLKDKLNHIENIGYTKEETLKLIETVPAILGFSKDTINKKIEDIMSLGYNKKEFISITKNFPAIYTLTIENIQAKKELYDNIGISDFILNDSKNLMQSVDLSYARYMFYKNIGIDITMNNYKLLFISNTQFKNKYGLSNDTLMKKYNYKTKKLVKGCI